MQLFNTLMINSPIEQFEVSSLMTVTGPITGDMVFAVTNFVLYTAVVLTVILGLHLLADNSYRLVPSYWSVMMETIYASVLSFARDQLGSKNEIYVPFIYSLFWMLMITNLSGNVPYGYTLTSSVVMSMGLSVTVFIAVTIMGFVHHRIHFFSYFVPMGTPLFLVPLLVLIELVSYFARAVSLGVRIFANMVAGHMLLAILSTFLFGLFTSGIIIATVTLVPFAIFTALVALEIAVSIIQAYVFCTLVSSYVHDSIDLH